MSTTRSVKTEARRARRTSSGALALVLVLGLGAAVALADEIVLVLKGGQRLTVTQLERRAGTVRGRTTKETSFFCYERRRSN